MQQKSMNNWCVQSDTRLESLGRYLIMTDVQHHDVEKPETVSLMCGVFYSKESLVILHDERQNHKIIIIR